MNYLYHVSFLVSNLNKEVYNSYGLQTIVFLSFYQMFHISIYIYTYIYF